MIGSGGFKYIVFEKERLKNQSKLNSEAGS